MANPDKLILMGQRIKAYRQRLGWTQSELAEAAQTEASTISRLERGGVEPRLSTLERIASALDMPMDEIWSSGRDESLSHLTNRILGLVEKHELQEAFGFKADQIDTASYDMKLSLLRILEGFDRKLEGEQAEDDGPPQ